MPGMLTVPKKKEYYRKVDQSRRIDNSFALPDDTPLTEEEIAQINEFWGKYHFAYPNIDYKSFQTFKNRTGKFDVRHIPGAVRTEMLSRFFVNSYYSTVFQNKAMLPMLYPEIKQPKAIVLRMNETFYDGSYQIISREEAISRIYLFVQQDKTRRVIVKPNASSGGHNISVIDCRTSPLQIEKIINNLGISAFIAQEMITQSSFTARFNPSSVNTIRVTSFIFKDEVHILASLIRIGKSGECVDNWCSGGALLGIDVATGKCLPWALGNDRSRVYMLSPGGLLSGKIDLREESLIVPNFDCVKETIKKLHAKIPYIQLISWDIALDQDDNPILIECNFGGMIQIHESTTGPLFGELTQDVLNTYLLQEFKLECSDENFVYYEYSDRASIHEYIGKGGEVTIPATLNKKPVVYIAPNAFRGKKVTKVSGPKKLLNNSKAALAYVK